MRVVGGTVALRPRNLADACGLGRCELFLLNEARVGRRTWWSGPWKVNVNWAKPISWVLVTFCF